MTHHCPECNSIETERVIAENTPVTTSETSPNWFEPYYECWSCGCKWRDGQVEIIKKGNKWKWKS